MTEPAPSVVYRIDSQDRIVYVNPEWDLFAAANLGETLTAEKVLGRSLWDFISGGTTVHLYREIVKRVRAGRAVRFPFRCDSPECRRFLEMTGVQIEDGMIEFRVRTLALEARPAVALLDPRRPRAGAPLRMCSWCKKLAVSSGWKELEAAVAELGLFESGTLPPVTHGICDECYEGMSRSLDLPVERPPK